jgi:hypothetical protein
MRIALALVAFGLFSWALEAGARPGGMHEPRAASALADAAPRATERALELLVLHATNRKRGFDARLRELPELTRPPFSNYDSYAVLERVRLPLEPKHSATHRLPNGRVLGAELVAVEDKDTVHVAASISEPGGRAFLPLLEVRARHGQHFIVAGQKYESGILVLVLTVLPLTSSG